MITIERHYLPNATPGILRAHGKRFASLELPWRDNALSVSCIPEGRYTLRRDHTGRHRWFRIDDAEVSPRSAIELHPCPSIEGLEGCVAPAMRLTGPWDRPTTVESDEACEALLGLLADEEMLEIRQYRPIGLDRWNARR